MPLSCLAIETSFEALRQSLPPLFAQPNHPDNTNINLEPNRSYSSSLPSINANITTHDTPFYLPVINDNESHRETSMLERNNEDTDTIITEPNSSYGLNATSTDHDVTTHNIPLYLPIIEETQIDVATHTQQSVQYDYIGRSSRSENSFPEYEFPNNFQPVQYNQQPPSYEEISQPLPHQQQVLTIAQSQQQQGITPEEENSLIQRRIREYRLVTFIFLLLLVIVIPSPVAAAVMIPAVVFAICAWMSQRSSGSKYKKTAERFRNISVFLGAFAGVIAVVGCPFTVCGWCCLIFGVLIT